MRLGKKGGLQWCGERDLEGLKASGYGWDLMEESMYVYVQHARAYVVSVRCMYDTLLTGTPFTMLFNLGAIPKMIRHLLRYFSY